MSPSPPPGSVQTTRPSAGRVKRGARRTGALARFGKAPAGVGLLLAPFVVAGGAVAVAALHAAAGAPLGVAFAGELWSLAKSLILMLVAYGPFAAAVHRVNRAALTSGVGAVNTGADTTGANDARDLEIDMRDNLDDGHDRPVASAASSARGNRSANGRIDR